MGHGLSCCLGRKSNSRTREAHKVRELAMFIPLLATEVVTRRFRAILPLAATCRRVRAQINHVTNLLVYFRADRRGRRWRRNVGCHRNDGEGNHISGVFLSPRSLNYLLSQQLPLTSYYYYIYSQHRSIAPAAC